MASVLEVEQLAKREGNFVMVQDVSFSVEEGEIFGGIVVVCAALGVYFFRWE